MKRDRDIDYAKYYDALATELHIDPKIIKKAHILQQERESNPQKMGKNGVMGWQKASKYTFEKPIFLINPKTVWKWRTETAKKGKYNILDKGLKNNFLREQSTHFSTALPRVYFTVSYDENDKDGYIWMDEGHNRVAWFIKNRKPLIPIYLLFNKGKPHSKAHRIPFNQIQYGKQKDIPNYMIPKHIDPSKIGVTVSNIEDEIINKVHIGGKKRKTRKTRKTRKRKTRKTRKRKTRKRKTIKRTRKRRSSRSTRKQSHKSRKRTRKRKTRRRSKKR